MIPESIVKAIELLQLMYDTTGVVVFPHCCCCGNLAVCEDKAEGSYLVEFNHDEMKYVLGKYFVD